MILSKLFLNRGNGITARHASIGCMAAVVILIGVSWNMALCRAQQPGNDAQGAQVLTRGPVHEAFAGIVTFNPEPGIVVTKAPPNVIEEMPPEEKPEGNNVTWIPGYWAWDDERSGFLWVSGTWRALPPGREWIAGYWGKTTQGHQWISGYWADTTAQETTYLPTPPATVEVGSNIAAPSMDYGWMPGCWIWYQGRYAWSPGYWAQGRADWDWVPAHYVWTPRGYIFVGGYWDYPVERRGVLFAPVYFESDFYSRRGYYYSPMIVIDLGVFTDHLFLRPRDHHYYFGDYYGTSYSQGGFYASFSFQSSRYGYDPIYSHQRWEHRQDRDWEHRVEASYQYRRDHETARPPRTWVAQQKISPGTVESRENRMVVATSIDQLAKRKDSPMRFQPVAREERQKLAQRGQEVQKSRDQRRTVEARAVDTADRKPGAVIEPVKVQLPRSPIVATPVNQLKKTQAPPQAQRAPKPDLQRQPRAIIGDSGKPGVEQTKPQPEPGKPDFEKKPTPGRSETTPREMQVQPESQPRPKEPGAKPQEQSPPDTRALEKKARQESDQRVKDAPLKTQEDLQPNARQLEPKPQLPPEQRAKDAAVKSQENSQRNARELEKKAVRTPEQPAQQKPAVSEKGAIKLLKKEAARKGEDSQKNREKPADSR